MARADNDPLSDTMDVHDVVQAHTMVLAWLARDTKTYDRILKEIFDGPESERLTTALVKICGALAWHADTELTESLIKGMRASIEAGGS